MNATQYAILAYAVSFILIGGFAMWSWLEHSRLTRSGRGRGGF